MHDWRRKWKMQAWSVVLHRLPAGLSVTVWHPHVQTSSDSCNQRGREVRLLFLIFHSATAKLRAGRLTSVSDLGSFLASWRNFWSIWPRARDHSEELTDHHGSAVLQQRLRPQVRRGPEQRRWDWSDLRLTVTMETSHYVYITRQVLNIDY